MNLVDILIWLVLLGFVVKGFTKGLIRQVCSLLGFLVGGWAAIKHHQHLAESSRHFIHLPPTVATILSFVCILLVVGLVFFFLGHLLTVLLNVILLGGVNRMGGVMLGFLEGAFILSLVLTFTVSSSLPERLRGPVLRSRTAEPFIATGREIVAGWGGMSSVLKSPVALKGVVAPVSRRE
jgi:membrane protein required for colicin V production